MEKNLLILGLKKQKLFQLFHIFPLFQRAEEECNRRKYAAMVPTYTTIKNGMNSPRYTKYNTESPEARAKPKSDVKLKDFQSSDSSECVSRLSINLDKHAPDSPQRVRQVYTGDMVNEQDWHPSSLSSNTGTSMMTGGSATSGHMTPSPDYSDPNSPEHGCANAVNALSGIDSLDSALAQFEAEVCSNKSDIHSAEMGTRPHDITFL